MMNKKAILLVCCLSIVQISQAQLGGLKNKLKDKVEEKKTEVQQQVPSSNATSQGTGSSDSRGRSRGGIEVKGLTVDLDYSSQPFLPAITYYDLLNKSNVYFNPTNGQFYFDRMDVAFLPTKKANGDAMKYESYNNTHPPIWMDLVNKTSGKTIGTLYYHANAASAPFSTLELHNRSGFPMSITIIEEGNYECKFMLGGKHFYTFPISISKLSNPDPYAPVKNLVFMDGPWRDAARIEYGTDGNLMFGFYNTHNTTSIVNAAQYETKKLMESTVKVKKGGAVVAVSAVDIPGKKIEARPFTSFNGKWNLEDFPLFKMPLDGNKKNFNKSNLVDGSYEVELTVKDIEKSTFETKNYTFIVSGGEILPSKQADRKTNTDPTTILEQGRKYAYLTKK
jgi:hypothetical protein